MAGGFAGIIDFVGYPTGQGPAGAVVIEPPLGSLVFYDQEGMTLSMDLMVYPDWYFEPTPAETILLPGGGRASRQIRGTADQE